MNTGEWILVLVLVAVIVYLLIKIFNLIWGYFSDMDGSVIILKPLRIPVGDTEFNAMLTFPKFACDDSGKPKSPLPLIIYNHGWAGSIDKLYVKKYTRSLAIAGPYAVLAYDCRGHGKNPGKREFNAQTFDDILKVIDFALTLEDIDSNHVGFMGVSMGGEIGLSRVYLDTRIKAIIASCSFSNAKLCLSRKTTSLKERIYLKGLQMTGVKNELITEEVNKLISPEFILKPERSDLNNRTMLVQARDDPIIHYLEMEKNAKIMGLPPENLVRLEKGGHFYLHQELIVLASAIRFFKLKL